MSIGFLVVEYASAVSFLHNAAYAFPSGLRSLAFELVSLLNVFDLFVVSSADVS